MHWGLSSSVSLENRCIRLLCAGHQSGSQRRTILFHEHDDEDPPSSTTTTNLGLIALALMLPFLLQAALFMLALDALPSNEMFFLVFRSMEEHF